MKTAAPAIDGSIAILDVLGRAPYPLQLSEICEQTGLASASAHRMINAMLRHQLVALSPGRRKTYAIGARVFQLSSAILGRQPIVPFFNPIAENLKNEIHRTILLSLPVGDQVVIVAKLDAPANRHFNAYVGRTMPMHMSASGKAMLAAQTPQDQIAYLRAQGAEAMPLPLAEELGRAARLGYAVTVNEIQQDVGCIAAPVLDAKGRPVAAISACFTGEMLTVQSSRGYSKNIVQAARQLTSQIR